MQEPVFTETQKRAMRNLAKALREVEGVCSHFDLIECQMTIIPEGNWDTDERESGYRWDGQTFEFFYYEETDQ